MRILVLGDVVGRPGRETVIEYLKRVKNKYDFIVVNGENAAGGYGINPEISQNLILAGADVITSGNHIWKKASIIPILSEPDSVILRPANYPANKPGKGHVTVVVKGISVQVINLQGRIFTDFKGDCPFKIADRIITNTEAEGRIVDFHADATSEKLALARFLDGRVNVFVGTHTHIQTADDQILPGGTAYLTDLGMCGSSNGVIGMDTKCSIGRFLSDRYSKLVVAQGKEMINGFDVFLDDKLSVSEIRRVYEYVQPIEDST